MRLSLTLAFALIATQGVAAPRFEPVEVFEHSYDGGWEHFVGGGVAVFDCSGNDRPDLYVAGGENPGALFLNISVKQGAIRLLHAGSKSLALTGVTGAYPIDIDSDGITDLAIARVGENKLMRGKGDCEFEEFTDLDFEGLDRWTTAFSATWEKGYTLPTLAFGNYVNRDDPEGPFEACDANHLYRPAGNAYGPAIKLDPGFCALSILFSDWGRNGRQDLRTSNDRHYYVKGGEEQMWAMEATPRLYTKEEGWQSFSLWGMGIASRDITHDGLPEVFLSSMGDQKLQYLQEGEDGPTYANAAYAQGTTAHRPYTGDDGRPSTGWQISFGDVDNDGRDDVFIAKGNVEQMLGSAMFDPNNLLMQNPDGTFGEMGDIAGVASMHRARGGAFADLNADGLLDLVVVNRSAPFEVYRNVTSTDGNYLKIKLNQSAPNVDAVGAWIEVEAGGVTHTREITIGGGHVSGTLVPEHFGLGDAEHARVRVFWPDGEVMDWFEVRAGRSVQVHR